MTIPDAPGLPPCFVGFAEHDGRVAALVDYEKWSPVGDCTHDVSGLSRFAVGWGAPLPAECDCERSGPCFSNKYETDDEAEALAVFARERDRLAEDTE